MKEEEMEKNKHKMPKLKQTVMELKYILLSLCKI